MVFFGIFIFSHITNTVLVPGRRTLVVSLVMAANTVTFGKKSVGNLSTTTFQTKLSDFYGNLKKKVSLLGSRHQFILARGQSLDKKTFLYKNYARCGPSGPHLA